MPADPNHVILTGENPFIRLSETDGGPQYHQRQLLAHPRVCPAGPGHVLYIKSELTEDRWRIYSDNIAMARWLQTTVQGMLNPELPDTAIPVTDAEFVKSGDPRYFWTERIVTSHDEEVALTWYDIGEPLLIHTQPGPSPAASTASARADPGARGAADSQRRAGRRARLADAARRAAVQHLRAGLLRELDRGALTDRSNCRPRARVRPGMIGGPGERTSPYSFDDQLCHNSVAARYDRRIGCAGVRGRDNDPRRQPAALE